MRKIRLFFFTLFTLSFSLHSLPFPEALEGIWEGKDRFVFFENNGEDRNEIVILLKEFYGWYYDRAAEPEEYSEIAKRSINDATTKKAEHIYFSLTSQKKNPLDNSDSENEVNAWEVLFEYSKYQKNIIPICIIDDCIYLNYYIQDLENPNFYRGVCVSKGISLDTQIIGENLSCLYLIGNNFFDIRYWKTDMEYSFDKASLTYEDNTYFVDKHIYSCGSNFSSTSGRSKIIRNVMKPVEFNDSDFIFNEDKSILARTSSLYLMRLADKKTMENLIELVAAANSRKKPIAPPPFESSNLDWHWDLIDELEKNNEIIQAVRERQKSFGLRGKDIGR